jgi:hypothetical protein
MAHRDALAAAHARIAALERALGDARREIMELNGRLDRAETEKDVAVYELASEQRAGEARDEVLEVLKGKLSQLEAELARLRGQRE